MDEIITIYAGKLFGSAGQSAINTLGRPEIQDAPQFHLVDSGKLDDNIFARWQMSYYTTLLILAGICSHGATAAIGSDLSSLRI